MGLLLFAIGLRVKEAFSVLRVFQGVLPGLSVPKGV